MKENYQLIVFSRAVTNYLNRWLHLDPVTDIDHFFRFGPPLNHIFAYQQLFWTPRGAKIIFKLIRAIIIYYRVKVCSGVRATISTEFQQLLIVS